MIQAAETQTYHQDDTQAELLGQVAEEALRVQRNPPATGAFDYGDLALAGGLTVPIDQPRDLNDVAVLDIQMPKASGIDVTRWVRANLKNVGVLVLTAYDDDPYILAVLQAGANGYILKTASPEEIIQAVYDVHEGKSVLDSSVAQKLMSPSAMYKSMEVDRSSMREELKDERVTSKPIAVRIELGEISIRGGFSKEVIQKTFKRGLSSMERCYQKALEKKPNVQGEATFQLAIDSSGRITKVDLVSSKLNDKNLEQCIHQKVKELTFPTPEGTDKVNVTVTLILKCS